MKRTPFAPRKAPLRPSKPLDRLVVEDRAPGKARTDTARRSRTPLRPRSKKRAAEEAKFARRKPVWLDGQVCAWCGTDQTLDIHHMRGRVGADLLDETHWLALCRVHHSVATDHPDWAKENGLSKDRTTRRIPRFSYENPATRKPQPWGAA